MNEQKLGVGIIGLGRIFPRHLEDSIKTIDELELAAVCDSDAKLAKKVGETEKVPYFTDYHQLIAHPDVDVVAIATPNGFHFEMALAVAKAGKDCVLEKPIAQNAVQAAKLVKAFEKSKGQLFPVLQVRYNPAVQTLKHFVDQGSLGELYLGALTIYWTRPQEYFDESSWKGSPDLDGGSLLTQSIHYIDVMQYILGMPTAAYGTLDTVKLKIKTEDTALVILEYSSKLKANIIFTIATYPHNLESSLTVLGETGSVKVGGLATNELEIWEVKNVPMPMVSKGVDPNVYAGGQYVGSCPNHRSIYENMVNVLVKKRPSFITAADAVNSIKIIDAIKKSAATGKKVKI